MQEKIQTVLSPLIIIVIAVVLRLLPHPANIAPIAAMALFGGAYLSKKYALILPLFAMFLSDLFLGFHASMLAVYVSFFLTGLIGIWLSTHKKVGYIIAASLVSSTLFYLLTNFNYWYVNALYPKTFAGVHMSYTAALPFFRNTILGDLFYVSVFFGSYALMQTFLKHFFVEKRKVVA